MSDDMSNCGVIPCAILVDNFASGLRVIAEGRQDAPYIENLKVGQHLYAITINDTLSKCNMFYAMASYFAPDYNYEYVCEQADCMVKLLCRRVNISKAVKEDEHTVHWYKTDYDSEPIYKREVEKIKAMCNKDCEQQRC